MVVNRIADLFFTIGMVVTYYAFQSVEFASAFGLAPYFNETTISILGLDVSLLTLIVALFFLGAMGKSAQLGLHT
jgi:NADH-quinone oxidoreductase subunit L